MTRWIAWAILFTVWATLLAGGAVAYFVTRTALLNDLDQRIVALARSLPTVEGHPEYRALEAQPSDALIVIDEQGKTESKSPALNQIRDATSPSIVRNALKGNVLPTTLASGFSSLGSGVRFRQLVLKFQPSKPGGNELRITYNYRADQFDEFMDRLALALTIFCAVAGLAAAAIAVPISRAALHPLRQTAETLRHIDERHLDQRIDVDALPIELQPVADRLNQMLGRIDLAFAQRKQFLADASHELRTPIAALVTTIEVALRRPRESADYVRTLKICLSDSRLLRQLVQTLLEHARSEAAPESPESFDAVALLNQCADVAEGLAGGRDIKLVRDLPARLEIESYPNRLRGIVMNLLGNAVEHNRAGGTVELHCEVRGSDLEVIVSDTGPGIPAEHIPHLFEPFYRAAQGEDEDQARQHMGLGLFLVDSHVKAMGGECRIDSEVGVGTSFHIRLPKVVVEEPQAVEASAV